MVGQLGLTRRWSEQKVIDLGGGLFEFQTARLHLLALALILLFPLILPLVFDTVGFLPHHFLRWGNPP
jgi:hypothetical protein